MKPLRAIFSLVIAAVLAMAALPVGSVLADAYEHPCEGLAVPETAVDSKLPFSP